MLWEPPTFMTNDLPMPSFVTSQKLGTKNPRAWVSGLLPHTPRTPRHQLPSPKPKSTPLSNTFRRGQTTSQLHNIVENFGLLYLHSFLQYFPLVCQDGLCMGHSRFGSEGLEQIMIASAWETEGLILTDGGSAESNCIIF